MIINYYSIIITIKIYKSISINTIKINHSLNPKKNLIKREIITHLNLYSINQITTKEVTVPQNNNQPHPNNLHHSPNYHPKKPTPTAQFTRITTPNGQRNNNN
jgi:hypothetical protein